MSIMRRRANPEETSCITSAWKVTTWAWGRTSPLFPPSSPLSPPPWSPSCGREESGHNCRCDQRHLTPTCQADTTQPTHWSDYGLSALRAESYFVVSHKETIFPPKLCRSQERRQQWKHGRGCLGIFSHDFSSNVKHKIRTEEIKVRGKKWLHEREEW